MAERVVELTDQVHIDHGEFMLLDWDGGNGQAEGGLSPFDLADQARSSGAWFLTSGNVAFIVGESGLHKATVFLERWDGEPPRDEGWAKVVDTTMFLSSSVVYVTGSGFPPSGRMLNLQGRGQEWSVRASVRPLGKSSTNVYPPDNIEEFRIQFWRA